VNTLPKTVSRQRRGCDLDPGPTAPESSTLTTRLPSHHLRGQLASCDYYVQDSYRCWWWGEPVLDWELWWST